MYIDIQVLEILRTFVGGQCQEDDPFVLEIEERLDGVLAHVGSHGQGIGLQGVEESLGVVGRGVPDVAALGIRDDEDVRVVVLDVLDGALQTLPAFGAIDLIESCVGLVSHGVRCGVVDNLLVELKNGVIHGQEFLRNLVDVGIQADAEERLLFLDLLEELLFVHIIVQCFLSVFQHSPPSVSG